MKKSFNKIRFLNPASIIISLCLPTVILVALPGFIIDGFIVTNCIISLLLLVIMLENDAPLKVTFLPSVVLLLTTFRLLLSIATTRNIIANEDVGHVIESVGSSVMDGNLLSGLLIFCIITIVQFLVVTKGSERIAEVGARFSLDAMPGRQMSIDGDLKSEIITPEQAQKARADLSTENKMYGSLDGSMKYVKGDAIAGILISLVNLFGGIYVGINEYQLSLSDSINKFSILTIGDGLVSQIPSLLLSVACGIYLTRIKTGNEKSMSLASQIISQVKGFWVAILMVSAVVFVIGIAQEDLRVVSLTLATVFAVAGIALKLTTAKTGIVGESEENESNGLFASLKFIVSDKEYQDKINLSVDRCKRLFWGADIGFPSVEIDTNQNALICIFICNINVFSLSKDDVNKVVQPLFDGVIYIDSIEDGVDAIVDYFVFKQLEEKYNLQITSQVMEVLENKSSVIKNEIDSNLGISSVHDVMKELASSKELTLDIVSFFEYLLYWSKIQENSKEWLARIRASSKYEITNSLLDGKESVRVMLLSPELTQQINGFIENFDDVDNINEVQTAIKKRLVDYAFERKCKPIVIVDPVSLSNVKTFMKNVSSSVTVCSFGEIAMPECIAGHELLDV